MKLIVYERQRTKWYKRRKWVVVKVIEDQVGRSYAVMWLQWVMADMRNRYLKLEQ